jgi:NAD(P)-dependent dehydrogenase (short-subunit alcohol dehydrogenase family)
MRLEGKVGIVVGAGQTPGVSMGTGRAAAMLFAREGARVLLVDRDIDAARETAALIADEGHSAEPYAGDWTRSRDCRAFADACVEMGGRIDFLQNNVGISPNDGHPLEVTEDAYDQIMDVNLKGCLLACQAVSPTMRAQGSGSIVNISSIAVYAYGPVTAYRMSKAGMNALTLSLAHDSAPHGVRVNAIMPGLVDTPMAIDVVAAEQGLTRETVEAQRAAMVPLGAKMGSAWDVAYPSLFLHSDEARFITGAILPVDGGLLAR